MTYHSNIIILAVLIILSAFFAMSEAALLSINRYKVRYMADKKKFGAIHAKKLKESPETLLSTILIGNNLVNVAAAAITTTIAIQLFESNALGIATGVATFLILVFGDIIPKSLGANNSDIIAPAVAPIIWYLSILIYPLIFLLTLLLKSINKIFGAKRAKLITEEELKTIIQTSEEEGTIREIERHMIERVFNFDRISVSDVMTSKKRMVSVKADMQIKDVLNLPIAKMYSRFPVYDKNPESIIGVLYLKDTLKYVKEGKFDILIRQIIRKPMFVFGNKKIDSMLKLFQSSKQHMAIVIDEKGRLIGLVTIENILEEIVGEIIDESDKINPNVIPLSKNEWVAKGSTELGELNLKTGISIKEADYFDLNHFISSTLGRLPRQGEEISYQNYKISMEDVQGSKVLKAKVVKT